jgi:hypothetical protein
MVLATAGCAVPRPDGRFHDPAGRFTLALPGLPWQAASTDGALASLRQPAWAAAIGLHADCRRPEPGPLAAVARHLFFGLQAAEVTARDPVQLAGLPAIRTHLRARLDAEPVEVEAVTVRFDPCLYDFLLVAAPAHFGEAAADFARVLASWTPEGQP